MGNVGFGADCQSAPNLTTAFNRLGLEVLERVENGSETAQERLEFDEVMYTKFSVYIQGCSHFLPMIHRPARLTVAPLQQIPNKPLTSVLVHDIIIRRYHICMRNLTSLFISPCRNLRPNLLHRVLEVGNAPAGAVYRVEAVRDGSMQKSSVTSPEQRELPIEHFFFRAVCLTYTFTYLASSLRLLGC